MFQPPCGRYPTSATTIPSTMVTDCTTAAEALSGPNTESITPTTTPGAFATTITEASIALGDLETSSNGDIATLMETGYGLAVAVTNSADKEISSPKPMEGLRRTFLFLGDVPVRALAV